MFNSVGYVVHGGYDSHSHAFVRYMVHRPIAEALHAKCIGLHFAILLVAYTLGLHHNVMRD